MKTFSSSISEIVNGKGSKASKVRLLVEMGLRPAEACEAYDVYYQGVKIHHSNTFNYTFGVEIECLFKKEGTLQSMRDYDVPFKYIGHYGHTNGNSMYEFKTDCSISGARGSYDPIELVTPVLKGKNGFDSLKKACKALNDNEAIVNKSTGLHVHIGVEGISNEGYINIFKNYKVLESVIDSFMSQSRRANNNTYSGTLQVFDFGWCSTIRDVANLMGTRYVKVNPMSYSVHKTVEFRQHQGTTDYEKIEHWVKFCAKLVEFSKTNLIEGEVTSIDQIPFLTNAEKAFFKGRQEALC